MGRSLIHWGQTELWRAPQGGKLQHCATNHEACAVCADSSRIGESKDMKSEPGIEGAKVRHTRGAVLQHDFQRAICALCIMCPCVRRPKRDPRVHSLVQGDASAPLVRTALRELKIITWNVNALRTLASTPRPSGRRCLCVAGRATRLTRSQSPCTSSHEWGEK